MWTCCWDAEQPDGTPVPHLWITRCQDFTSPLHASFTGVPARERRAHKARPSLINGLRCLIKSGVTADEYTTENNNHSAISGNIIACVLQKKKPGVPFYNTSPIKFNRCILKSFPRCPIMPSARFRFRNTIDKIYDKTVTQGSAYADKECDWLISVLDCQDGGYTESNDPERFQWNSSLDSSKSRNKLLWWKLRVYSYTC